MGVECSYSFWDLYKEAFSEEASEKVKQEFYRMTQDERNARVSRWAEMAGWETDDRIGSDGLTYTAFAPTFTPGLRPEKSDT